MFGKLIFFALVLVNMGRKWDKDWHELPSSAELFQYSKIQFLHLQPVGVEGRGGQPAAPANPISRPLNRPLGGPSFTPGTA